MNGVGHIRSLYDWEEVTGGFLDACNQLELGELLHDEMFGLFEAMSAFILSFSITNKLYKQRSRTLSGEYHRAYSSLPEHCDHSEFPFT